ncbi:PREDICTED: neurotrimin-like [Cyphomyrmex costatus]|uniref:neurotrimin-like n=1 Tax=Cyphomyrmex costatus TaxID=456900 RepID=UPI0008522748|nr:PREDICTED: neurotrimin-like [Cyphomyrmex costatus]
MLCHRALVILIAVNVPIVTGLEPDFAYPLENVTIPQGRDATFTCVVNNLGGYRVSPSSSASGDHSGSVKGNARVAWIKADTKAILAIHEHVITNNARLSVTHSDYNTWTLNIRSARREDRGIYMCQVNTDPMKSQSAFLEVVIPPDIISEETSNDMMVPEGGAAKLVCKARGYPKPDIVWKREDGTEIISRAGPGKTKIPSAEGEVLTLSKVTRGEMGAYLCIASNGVPPSVSKRMMLHVHFHPMVQVPNQLVGAPIGTNVTLVCHVEASPKAINYWTRESDEMIITNSKYAMSEVKTSVYSVQMRLVIMNLQKHDLGGYKCISKNSIGDAEGNIRLYDMELPKHSKKGSDRRSEDDAGDSIGDRDHRLNHAHQGSLRETGSTLEPAFDADDNSASTTSRDNAPPATIGIVLIMLHHLVAST